ncbi:diguanylate cyclase domain-containing protein [Aliiruegeria lutimaris]|uniref:diguanylate cyclase domain-containing protein n=1 Tax=Aliiruegeria lutimaris TaxID=571298 RepID=UPI000B82A911
MEQARQTAERIHMVLEDRIHLGEQVMTASIGVACRERGVADLTVVEAADQAMQAARTAGRNRIVCAGLLSAAASTEARSCAGAPARGPRAQRMAALRRFR